MLNQPYDGRPPGFTRTPTVGPVVQLSVRTRGWAYIGTFVGALFDMHADPGEMRNLAYSDSAAAVRWWLLRLVLQEWDVTLASSPNATRWERAEWLRKGKRRSRKVQGSLCLWRATPLSTHPISSTPPKTGYHIV
ncbi:hypothetical protein EMIHUDRAFT_229440 [Emiliania huxleyi CCMP1516]|uniref:Uncharacterized protein n=2 Tax=Emiliania huxleyi TaxID=2903 RepID=A0A0D3JRB4_EMIH1|nr:hypothetical protein EMIHUDRAFT_237200 [Emiliania huxleyi CCMP1516]XP_005786126.1 hypothetical protein EMIHUDRAFT_229440 [Emiliania huxleyi CCMP1516]EOD26049.1 hypothetical protein EMIHUDRAFT_237200 [Emiliania huxleyi CCMP1516]EOD33697.1 hypothetical protein EMIHUDRAFT_229440 [Emiliania huxleyi CCMP1516]|eukprot:XP_005778478.1 hypothetical protein EMIHUDRAFT_237200 [Emiliania huxleyi CCMP1516]